MSKSILAMGVVLATVTGILLAVSAAMAAEEDRFPLRKKWPDLAPISTSELAAARSLNEAVVVDVRTAAEYDIMHIEGSHHFPHDAFLLREPELSALTQRPHKVLVFYCNGTTCTKSYKAAELATSLRYKGVRVYDDGIFEWAKTYPEETLFFGRKMTRANVEQFLVNEEDFAKGPWLVDTLQFIEMAKSRLYTVLDIRDSREKVEYPIQLPDLKEATIDQLVKQLKADAFPKSKVLVLDNVGKQVIWVKYYFDRNGVKDYFFLRGGVRQWRADGRDSKGDKLGKVYGRPAPK
ncbi:MAG: rhodanese-like domain-containing protein [Thermodesulfobacteriota bacterium]